jgi:hypothetical protein
MQASPHFARPFHHNPNFPHHNSLFQSHEQAARLEQRREENASYAAGRITTMMPDRNGLPGQDLSEVIS